MQRRIERREAREQAKANGWALDPDDDATGLGNSEDDILESGDERFDAGNEHDERYFREARQLPFGDWNSPIVMDARDWSSRPSQSGNVVTPIQSLAIPDLSVRSKSNDEPRRKLNSVSSSRHHAHKVIRKVSAGGYDQAINAVTDERTSLLENMSSASGVWDESVWERPDSNSNLDIWR